MGHIGPFCKKSFQNSKSLQCHLSKARTNWQTILLSEQVPPVPAFVHLHTPSTVPGVKRCATQGSFAPPPATSAYPDDLSNSPPTDEPVYCYARADPSALVYWLHYYPGNDVVEEMQDGKWFRNSCAPHSTDTIHFNLGKII